MEASALYFKNGTVKYIYDDMYSNSWEIKSFIKQIVIDKNDTFEITDSIIKELESHNEFFEVFKGNPLTSMRGITLWGIIIFFAFIILSAKEITSLGIIIMPPFLLFIVIVSSRLMHYFKVSKNYFVVKNHNFIWKQHIYKIADLREIVFETQGKQPNSLRVITNDFKSKLYPAGTLRNKNWLELKKNLEKKGIRVRNEIYI